MGQAKLHSNLVHSNQQPQIPVASKKGLFSLWFYACPLGWQGVSVRSIQADGATPISKGVPTLPEPKEARGAGAGGLEPAATAHVFTVHWPEVAI